MESNNFGIVYVLTNPCNPGLVKIGRTTRDGFAARMHSLSTSTLDDFECIFACKVDIARANELEQSVHELLSAMRPNKSKEFFSVPTDEIKMFFDILCRFGDCEDVTGDMIEEMDGVRSKRPLIDYLALGLKIGDKLTFVNDETVVCTVAGHRKVNCGDQKCVSLYSITKPLVGAVRPAFYWKTENGITLDKLYDEHHNQ